MRLARGYLLLMGAVFAVLGVLYAVAPTIFLDATGFEGLAPEALTDYRATYGGLQIGIGGFLLWAALDASRHRAGFVALSIMFPAIAAARLYGLAVDGEWTNILVAALALEIILSVSSLILLRKRPTSTDR